MKPLVLSGQNRTDAMLWQFSSILAEIAENSVRDQTNGTAGKKVEIQKRTNNERANPVIEGSADG